VVRCVDTGGVQVHIELDQPNETELKQAQSQLEPVVRAEIARIPDVVSVDHFFVHYVNNKLMVHLDVSLSDDLSAKQMRLVVAETKRRVGALDHVDKVGVHVSLVEPEFFNPS